jgi:hypothetical protein
MAETLREAGRTAIEQAGGFETQVSSLAVRRSRPIRLSVKLEKLLASLASIETAGAAATERVAEARNETSPLSMRCDPVGRGAHRDPY